MSAFRGKADMTLGRCLLSRSLLGVKRTLFVAAHMSASDPERTLDPRPIRVPPALGLLLLMRDLPGKCHGTLPSVSSRFEERCPPDQFRRLVKRRAPWLLPLKSMKTHAASMSTATHRCSGYCVMFWA